MMRLTAGGRAEAMTRFALTTRHFLTRLQTTNQTPTALWAAYQIVSRRAKSSARPLPDEMYEWQETVHHHVNDSRRHHPSSLAHYSQTPNKLVPVYPAPTKALSAINPIRTAARSTEETNSRAKFSSVSVSMEEENDELLLDSPAELKYTGGAVIPITSRLHLVTPEEDTPSGTWPVFRLMDESGEFRDPAWDGTEHGLSTPAGFPAFERNRDDERQVLDDFRDYLCDAYPFQAAEVQASELLHAQKAPFADTHSVNPLLRAHHQILRLREMDSMLQNAQRQGRISFYMTCTGEEAMHLGTASALDAQDQVFTQYREQGILMWRGFTLEQFANQCFSTDRDLGKGRQMPVHYGSRALNFHTVSSPLGTQLPQAVGAAYRLKLQGKKNVAVAFFGDGCASTTDFHAALNFAATLSAPTIFFCRNNGYAISTPVTDQYAGDGIVSRAPGYGMAAIRVDGNDLFAVHAAVREARKYALEHNAPVLIEGMSYRQGHHSTSDDSTRYRSKDEIEDFVDRMDPLIRLENFLIRHDFLTEGDATAIKQEERVLVLEAIKAAESRAKPPMESMFEDVYKETPKHLQEQLAQLKAHVAKYPDKY